MSQTETGKATAADERTEAARSFVRTVKAATRRKYTSEEKILRKLPVRSSGLLRACSVSWLWWLGFTGRATTGVSDGEVPLAPWAGPSSWS